MLEVILSLVTSIIPDFSQMEKFGPLFVYSEPLEMITPNEIDTKGNAMVDFKKYEEVVNYYDAFATFKPIETFSGATNEKRYVVDVKPIQLGIGNIEQVS